MHGSNGADFCVLCSVGNAHGFVSLSWPLENFERPNVGEYIFYFRGKNVGEYIICSFGLI